MLEKLNNQKQQIRNNEEELNQQMNDRTSELSRIFMTIENLNQICETRARDCKLDKNQAAYNVKQFNQDLDDKKLPPFSLDKKRLEIATAQLSVVNQYMIDFQAIMDTVRGKVSEEKREVTLSTYNKREEKKTDTTGEEKKEFDDGHNGSK